IVVGIGILAIALWIVSLYAVLERQQMMTLVGAVFTPKPESTQPGLRGAILNATAWKRVLYFALRLPLSIAGFAVSIFTVVSMCLVFAPLVASTVPISIDSHLVTDWQEAIVVACAGALLGLLGAHAVNAVAEIERMLAEWLL
ncbi:MAG: sensor domain-containing protein, partial [Bryobacteraceae bacterium]